MKVDSGLVKLSVFRKIDTFTFQKKINEAVYSTVPK
jgi:hypothetical protein